MPTPDNANADASPDPAASAGAAPTSAPRRGQSGRQLADDLLILQLLQGKTILAAAAAAGISESTAHRRLKDGAFQKKLTGARAALSRQILDALADACLQKAIPTLSTIAGAGYAAKERIQAAARLLQSLAGLKDLDLEARLAELEAAHKGDK